MMKVKFANGDIKECTAPTEHKVFKTIGSETIGIGWVLAFKIIGEITSVGVDALLKDENVSSLEFLSETDNGEQTTLFSLDGYKKNRSSIIVYAEDIAKTSVEIQLMRGV